MVNVTAIGDREEASTAGGWARAARCGMALLATMFVLLPTNDAQGQEPDPQSERQFGITGELGVRFVEDARAAALLGVELRAYDETRWSSSRTGETVAERRTFAPIGAALTIGEGGTIADYQLRTLPVGWLRAERVDARRLSTMKGFVETTIGRELALDRQLTVDIALIRSMLDLWEGRTHITIDARLLGWRHVRFASDDGTYNGARLLQLGARVGQRIGGSERAWLEPFVSLSADTSLGAQRERRFTTDVLVDASAGVHVAFGRSVSWESAASYRGVRNRIRLSNAGAWRVQSAVSVTY